MRELNFNEIDTVSGGHYTGGGDDTLRELHEEHRRREATGRDHHCTTNTQGHVSCVDVGPASDHRPNVPELNA